MEAEITIDLRGAVLPEYYRSEMVRILRRIAETVERDVEPGWFGMIEFRSCADRPAARAWFGGSKN